MIYPSAFESKTGFDDIRSLLREQCLSTLGKERVGDMTFSADNSLVNEWLCQVREFRRLKDAAPDFPLQYFFDMREAVARLRLDGTWLEEGELHDLRRSLTTILSIKRFFQGDAGEEYPALCRLADDVQTFPEIVRCIDRIIDKFGRMRDDASPELATIRRELARTEGSISRALNSLLKTARMEGLVDKDASPTMRDGRLVIPVAPALKRKIPGIVHDESASGKTVFIEPAEVVEANNRIRELESDERREIVRLLKETASEVRPHIELITASYRLLADIDFIRSKAELARLIGGYEPTVEDKPLIDYIRAEHPLLRMTLSKQGKSVTPLDITLTTEQRILIISGPNAGGKSVCLKTVGLLQYMLQCGLSIPVDSRSRVGIFKNILIDIGDEQSIENDLSTYSSHLTNMKQMMRHADGRTLLLVDELGTGTEPQIGGAIAESVLRQFLNKGAFAVITTHYQNLKHFAEENEGVANGAMLYDRQEMRPLFRLAIGQPGSSFAIEIARKIGLPEDVIRDAADIVGSDYIQSDKYLQDIIRDKRYWESKRQTVHRQEKELKQAIARYEEQTAELQRQRKEIIQQAREQATAMIDESRSRIERTIREIKESQAEREDTRRIRHELETFRDEVSDTQVADDIIERKMRQIEQRRERKAKKAREKAAHQASPKTGNVSATANMQPVVGDSARIKGLTAVGTIESIEGKTAVIVFGNKRTRLQLDKIERVEKTATGARNSKVEQSNSHTRAVRYEMPADFNPDIDVRGMRGDEAVSAVTYFIDDAVMTGMHQVRILHGTGSGILRSLIRQYLATVPAVNAFHDEHVQFGGAGITVVEL